MLAAIVGARQLPASRARHLLAIAAVPTLVTLVFEWTTGKMPANAVRAGAGVVLGAGVMWLLATVVNPSPRSVELH
jgi:hypothetical protein